MYKEIDDSVKLDKEQIKAILADEKYSLNCCLEIVFSFKDIRLVILTYSCIGSFPSLLNPFAMLKLSIK